MWTHALFGTIRAMLPKKNLQQAVLAYARDLAGGVTYLARKVGMGADSLDAMLHGAEPIPSWVFLRAVDFVNEAREQKTSPRGLPENWLDFLEGSAPKQPPL